MKRLFIFLFFASPCFGATVAQLVQCGSQYFGAPAAGTGGTINLTNPVSAGDGLIVRVGLGSGTASSATAMSNQGDSFTQVTGYPLASSGNFAKITDFYAQNAVGGTTSVTVKLNVTDFLEVSVCEVAQQARSASIIDKTAEATGNSGTLNSGSVTTTQADLALGYLNCFNNTITSTGGFTLQNTFNATNSIIQSLLQSTSGSVAAQGTCSSSLWTADLLTIGPVTTAALTSVTIAPTNPSAGAGIDTQFTLTAHYADSSTANVSSIAAWTSSSTTVASITQQGLATGIHTGSTTIQGSFGGFNANTTFTVTSSTPYNADDFLGWINTPTNCSGHPQTQNFTTGSQSGTTQTVTVTDGTKFALNEAIMLLGSSTAMDWQFIIKTAGAGTSHITNIAGNVITLTAATSATVAGPTTGTFVPAYAYTQIVSGRAEICTPENHWIFPELVAASSTAGVGTKYTSTCQAAATELLRMVNLNFNGTGEDSNNVYDPTGSLAGSCATNRKFMGILGDANVSGYASNNLNNYASQPVKNIDNGTTSNYPGCRYHLTGSALMDYFDPNFATWMGGFFPNGVGNANAYQSPFVYTIAMLDDTDNVVGVGAGPNYSTVINPGSQNCDAAWIVMNSSPIQVGNNFELYPTGGASANYLYPDPIVYSKVKAASPPATCTVSTPCTLRDYFFKKYSGSISSLNTAEGTGGKYDTFDSDGVCVGWNFNVNFAASECKTGNGSAAFALGTGNGSTLTFTGTLSTNVDKHSVGIFDNGVLVGADCPVEVNNCGAGAAGTGIFTGAVMSGGSINYSTGAVSVTFSSAPANGHTLTINYIHDGYGYCGVLTNCGLMDQDGVSTAWQGTNGICLVENPCAGGDQAPANAQATFGSDLDGYVVDFWSEYFGTIKTKQNATYPGTLYWGIDNVGSFCSPAHKGVYQAANQWVDVLFHISYCETIDDSTSLSKYDFVTTYFTAGPMVQFTVYTSSQSNDACGGNVPCFATQAARGISAYHTVSDFLNLNGHDGVMHHSGWVQWGTHNFQSSGFGILTNLDNLYDGVEDVVATVSCSAPASAFNCGGESGAANFLGSNGLTATQSYQSGNALWFAGTPPPPSNGCLVGSGVIIGTGTIFCETLNIKYSTPNPLTFTYTTPNTLNLVVAAISTPPPPSPFPVSGACITPKSQKNKVWHCGYTVLSATQQNCNCI